MRIRGGDFGDFAVFDNVACSDEDILSDMKASADAGTSARSCGIHIRKRRNSACV
jgi:hypothetical protein